MNNFQVVLSRAAKTDLTRITCWYEAQSNELGKSFLSEYQAQKSRIQKGPFQYQVFIDEFRRCSIKKFPYHIYYEIAQDRKQVVIQAIYHQQRGPEVIAQQLSDF